MMTVTRTRLPQRRPALIVDTLHELGGQPLTATIGFDAAGRPSEIFLDAPKSSPMAELARDGALLISLALQYGIPVEIMRNAVGRGDAEPRLPHTIIGTALDLLAQIPAELEAEN